MVEEGLSRRGEGLADEDRSGEIDEAWTGPVELVVLAAMQHARSFERTQLPQGRAGHQAHACCSFGEAHRGR